MSELEVKEYINTLPLILQIVVMVGWTLGSVVGMFATLIGLAWIFRRFEK
tara:strand:+ start:445 stop:594 length:150 start_codon:yes stop_codon:yes gene_type:complete